MSRGEGAPSGWILPVWPAPARVRACATTRLGGVSEGPYASLNLGAHVGDRAEHVAENRRRVREALALPAEPAWLEQVHGIQVVRAEQAPARADGAWTDAAGVVCAVLTADCLPVLFCDEAGSEVAAAHAGWRGLLAGVLEETVLAMGLAPRRLLAWLGPAIGPRAFEVGEEVREAFLAIDVGADVCFTPSPRGRWLADLPGLARRRLQAQGLARIYGGHDCTYQHPDRFFSYRRDGQTGRMAALIWLAQ